VNTSVLIADALERATALDITASWIVEAPAGSGKTGLLIQRYLKLLAAVDAPGEVLALTFTNKATAEMQARVIGALASAKSATQEPTNEFAQLTHSLARNVLERDEVLGWRLLERPHLLNIRTIDSLCGEIARATPLQAGVAGFARPAADADPLYQRAAHAVMMRFGGDDEALNDAVRTVLLHRDGDLPFCERVLAEMLATREQWGSLVPLREELEDERLETVTLPRLNASLERTVCEALTRLREGFDDGALAEIASIARRLATADGHNGAASAFVHCIDMPHTPGCGATDLHYWEMIAQLLLTKEGWRASFAVNHVGAAVEKRDKERLKELIFSIESTELFDLLHTARSFKSCQYPPEQWKVAKALFRLLQHAVVELQLLFAREEVCDFSEVSLAARGALRENAQDVQTLLGTRLRHLLVDEMQDTSTSQYELLTLLTAGWDGGSQTVFLVGDPKQSIYLFRQARVELFQQILADETLGSLPVGALRLSTNFRSGADLVRQFNETFASIFPAEINDTTNSTGDVAFHAAEAALPASDADSIDWEMALLPPPPKDLVLSMRNRRRALKHEAREIAYRIASWRNKQPHGKPAKIAVLTRARTHVTEITKALARAGVPYRAVEMEGLDERLEVLDILAITRALIHPADRTAWLALLRAPWCGLGLADLHTLAAGDDNKQRKHALRLRMRERVELLPAQSRERARRTLNVMDAALQHTGAASLADRVERTWRSLGGDACCTALECENVAQFLRVLDAMEAEGEAITAASLDRRLQRLYALPSHAVDAVDVMTIHKAKGLEWDVVFVPGMHRRSAADRWPFLDWLELPTYAPDGTRDVLLAPLPPKGDDAGALNQYIRATRTRRGNAELKRVFYVAATRAKTLLYLSAWPESKKDGTASVINGTLLKAAWPAANAYMPQLVAAPTTSLLDSLADEIDTIADQEPLALAAAAEAEPPREHPKLQRLLASVDPLAELHNVPPVPRATRAPQPPRFERPEGTFGARAVGNAIHAFVERLANEIAARARAGIATDSAMSALSAELPSWSRAIHASLRSGGLPLDVVERAAVTVLDALKTMLASGTGRWILEPHRMASTEAAWRSGSLEDNVRVRLDRSFFAGSLPMQPGNDTLWIVDFKTGNRTGNADQQDKFLEEERTKYEGQLRAYAEVRLRSLPAGSPVMLALFYPLMGRLISWPYETAPSSTPPTPATATKASREQLSLFG
jgi:ATP-dependent helicase/nuclease subunit A